MASLRVALHHISSSGSSSSWLGGRIFWGPERCGHTFFKIRPLRNLPMSFSESLGYSSKEFEDELALVKRKCTSCSSKELRPMTEASAKTLLDQIPGWELVAIDGRLQLQRTWKAKNFVKGLEFITSIANVAESEGHHPDLHLVNWNDVKANIWTHSVGGVTENDFILAAKINALKGDGLLRRSAKPPTLAS